MLQKNKSKNIIRLCHRFGVSFYRATNVVKHIGLNLRKGALKKPLSKSHRDQINSYLKRYTLGKSLKFQLRQVNGYSLSIRRYKSIRNKLRLPCRGQRTKTNAKTRRKLNFWYTYQK